MPFALSQPGESMAKTRSGAPSGRKEGEVPSRARRSPLRAIFLDFDGVLHPRPAVDVGEPGLGKAPDFLWVPALAALLEPHPDVLVVVHSTWRYNHSTLELAGLLGPLKRRVVDSTPRGPRFESIEWWLSMNPQIKNYRILDDDAREFPVPQPTELILCHPATGVADERVRAALRSWLER